jgi:restriction system protein
MEKTAWFVRAGRNGWAFNDFIKNGVVAIGRDELGDLSKIIDLRELEDKAEKGFKDYREGQKRSFLGQLTNFRFNMNKGDLTITYDPSARTYQIGTIIGDCEYKPGLIEYFPIVRKVKWESSILRDALSSSTRNSLGAIQTIFRPSDDAVKEILAKIKGETYVPTNKNTMEIESNTLARGVIEQADELIKDKLVKLSWEDMQELVAGILRAMGYKTKVASPGPDRGVDISASPDGLGLTHPRIFVEVKHRQNEQIGSKDIRNLIAGRNAQQDKCLFVSTGGYSKDAKLEADRSTVPVTLLDLDDLADLLVQYYENIDPETKALIPLVKVYWPQA